MKLFFILFSLVIPVLGFAQKNVVVATSADPGHLNPGITTGYNVHVFADSIYSGLVMLDRSLQPSPDLAESWQIEDNSKTYRFFLRKNARWHDGKPVTSKDVKFTFENVLFKYHSRTKAGLSKIVTEIQTPTDHEVVFKLSNSYGPMLSRLNVTEAPILPAHIFGNGDANDHPANLNPVGSGPFKFVEYRKGEYVKLQKNENYYLNGLPKIDNLIIQVIPDGVTQLLALERGEVDYIDRVPGKELRRMEANSNISLQKNTAGPGGGNCIMTISFNLEREKTSNYLLRQAFAHAIDRERILEQVLFGLGRVAAAPINKGIEWAHRSGTLANYDFNQDKANQLLDQARFSRGGDGVRMSLDIVHFPRFNKYAEVMKQDLAQVGINLISRPMDRSAAVDTIFNQRDFDLNLISYCNGADPDIVVKRMYVSSNIGNIPFSNASAYRNPEIDTLFKEAGQTSDIQQRSTKYSQIQTILAEELPYWWLVETQSLTAHRSDMSNFRSWSGNFAVMAQ